MSSNRILGYLLTCIAVFPVLASAQLLGSPYGKFTFVLRVEDSGDQAGIHSIATAVQILDNQEKVGSEPNAQDAELSFFFASGRGFIENDRVSIKALEQFPRELVDAVVNLPTNTDVCYVQGFKLLVQDGSRTQNLVVSVHDSTDAEMENAYRCFAAAVWYFKFGNIGGFEASRWREMLAKVIGSSRRD